MLRFHTAGESHGEAMLAWLSGIPSGLAVDFAAVNRELWRRQQGYGRSGRMKLEKDEAHFLSGVRHGKTIGSPLAILIGNKDWENWSEALPVENGDPGKHKGVFAPRPGHADLAGVLKHGFADARYVLERASARETAARVAAGAVAKLLLKELGIEVASHVVAIGAVALQERPEWKAMAELRQRDEVLLNCADSAAEQRMKAEVDKAFATADTVGGVFEVVVHGVPPGIGSYSNWDERLDAQLAAAVMSIQSVKAVEIGSGVAAAGKPGSETHDAITYAPENGARHTRFGREGNMAGGIEGGVTNGEDVVVRGHVKPISTLRRPLGSVDLRTREAVAATYERSDVCAVPAAGVIGEGMVALTLAGAALNKFGGDSMPELLRNYRGYLEQLERY